MPFIDFFGGGGGAGWELGGRGGGVSKEGTLWQISVQRK